MPVVSRGQGDINITTAANVRELLNNLTSVEKKLDDLARQGKRTQEAAAKTGQSFDDVAGSLTKFAGAIGATQLLRMEVELTKVGASSIRLNDSLDAVFQG